MFEDTGQFCILPIRFPVQVHLKALLDAWSSKYMKKPRSLGEVKYLRNACPKIWGVFASVKMSNTKC